MGLNKSDAPTSSCSTASTEMTYVEERWYLERWNIRPNTLRNAVRHGLHCSIHSIVEKVLGDIVTFGLH